ncbi:MAG: hypothetical protein FWC20_10685 [Oscillospiraceae bacterium]|nr:hypothetical protein [Oscillospiraceae bacterium]MCL2279854.1 hypothetical protein [Oscillospiraceae bacterium]
MSLPELLKSNPTADHHEFDIVEKWGCCRKATLPVSATASACGLMRASACAVFCCHFIAVGGIMGIYDYD